MEKISIRPLMTIPKDRHEAMVKAAAEMGLSFNQYAGFCLVAGAKSMEKMSLTEPISIGEELGAFIKGLGVAPDIAKVLKAEMAAQEKMHDDLEVKIKARAKKVAKAQ